MEIKAWNNPDFIRQAKCEVILQVDYMDYQVLKRVQEDYHVDFLDKMVAILNERFAQVEEAIKILRGEGANPR
jgi:hypothetical protein